MGAPSMRKPGAGLPGSSERTPACVEDAGTRPPRGRGETHRGEGERIGLRPTSRVGDTDHGAHAQRVPTSFSAASERGSLMFRDGTTVEIACL